MDGVGRLRVAGFIAPLLLLGCASAALNSNAPTPTPSTSMGPPVVVQATPAGAAAAVIIGGVQPCQGIISHSGPRYAEATVSLLRGKTSLQPAGQGMTRTVMPATLVARVAVATDQQYHFVVGPGDYVIEATFPPPANVVPWASVSVHSGETARKDVPNMCM
jgi:hypothetical protein